MFWGTLVVHGSAYLFFVASSSGSLTVPADYVFQGHRFDIIEDIGCNPATYVSIPTIICILIPPVLISLTSLVFSREYFFPQRMAPHADFVL